MTILLFSSILSTKRQWQSSTSTRPVWQHQKCVMSRIQSKEAIFDCQHQNGELARLWRCPDCDSQKVQHQASHAIKTRRGRSTLCQAHVLPPHAVKTRGGRSTFYHGHGEVHLLTSHISEPLFPGGTSVFRVHTILMPPNLPRFRTAPWSPLRRQNRDIQKWD